MTGILDALKGTGGRFEVNRVLGAAGVTVYIISAPGFVAWHMARGGVFDLIAFCAAYPGGLGVAIGALAGAVAVKDRNVSTARVTGAQADAISASTAADVKAANEAAPPPPIPSPAPAGANP